MLPFNKKQLKKFFVACAEYPKKDQGRYTTLFATLLITGARPAELVPTPRSAHVPLLKSEVDYDAATITIRSSKQKKFSRGKVRVAKISLDLLEMVKKAAKETEGPHVFTPLYKTATIFNAIMKKADLPRKDTLLDRKWTAHSFRHSYATLMNEKIGGDPFTLKEALGHTKIETTDRYVQAKAPAEIIDLSEFLWQKPMAEKEKTAE